MMEDELVKIWQSSPGLEQVKFEKSRLMLDVQSGINRLDKLVKRRDAIESAVAIFVVTPAFTFTAFMFPNIFIRLACILIVLWSFYVVYRLRNARKYKPDVTDNYIQYLHKSKAHLIAQKKMLETVLWWYVLPAQSGVTLFCLGIALETGSYQGLIKMEVLGLGLAIATVYLNQQAVKKTLMPRLEKIDELIGAMEK